MNQAPILTPAQAYRMWAPAYSPETAVSLLDDELVTSLTPELEGLTLLDAGCGTARRLLGTQACMAIGVDASIEMLASAPGEIVADERIQLMVGDLRSLPLDDQSVDVIWCRLALGHVPECAGVYAEFARVSRPEARIIVSDFHPAAVEAGHQRTFRDGPKVFAIEHHVHSVPVQIAAASAGGLECVDISEAVVGPSIRSLYVGDDAEARYRAHEGLPLVLVLSFRRQRH